MGRGRGVHHHLVAAGFPDQAVDLQPGQQLVGAGQGEVEEPLHVFLVEVGAAGGDFTQGAAVLLAPAAEGRAGRQLDGQQTPQNTAPGFDGGGLGGEAHPEGVAQGVGRIGGDGQHAPAGFAGFGKGQGGGRGTGGLADAAFTSEEGEPIRPGPRRR